MEFGGEGGADGEETGANFVLGLVFESLFVFVRDRVDGLVATFHHQVLVQYFDCAVGFPLAQQDVADHVLSEAHLWVGLVQPPRHNLQLLADPLLEELVRVQSLVLLLCVRIFHPRHLLLLSSRLRIPIHARFQL